MVIAIVVVIVAIFLIIIVIISRGIIIIISITAKLLIKLCRESLNCEVLHGELTAKHLHCCLSVCCTDMGRKQYALLNSHLIARCISSQQTVANFVYSYQFLSRVTEIKMQD